MMWENELKMPLEKKKNVTGKKCQRKKSKRQW